MRLPTRVLDSQEKVTQVRCIVQSPRPRYYAAHFLGRSPAGVGSEVFGFCFELRSVKRVLRVSLGSCNSAMETPPVAGSYFHVPAPIISGGPVDLQIQDHFYAALEGSHFGIMQSSLGERIYPGLLVESEQGQHKTHGELRLVNGIGDINCAQHVDRILADICGDVDDVVGREMFFPHEG